jgi:2-polyprenyl-3-methyl-5-hydroxy-6-metoxy-1,4-benzoquinol methylase
VVGNVSQSPVGMRHDRRHVVSGWTRSGRTRIGSPRSLHISFAHRWGIYLHVLAESTDTRESDVIIVNASELELVACDLCGGTSTRQVVTRPDGLHAVECSHCGLCYLNPRPRGKVIQRLYNDEYFSKAKKRRTASQYGYNEYLGDVNQSLLRRAAEVKLRLISRYADVGGRSCLEAGCATGEFCELIENHGGSITGFDLSAEAINLAKVRYPRIDFRQGDLSAVRKEELFDLIFAFEIIEHVESPTAFIEGLAVHLKPGGLLIITTPNYNCGKRVGVDQWAGFQSSLEHLYFFNSKSVSDYATKAGLTKVFSLTGCGDGVEVKSGVAGRELLRKIFQRLRILNLVRRCRPRLTYQSPDPNYVEQDDFHCLFMVLAKV